MAGDGNQFDAAAQGARYTAVGINLLLICAVLISGAKQITAVFKFYHGDEIQKTIEPSFMFAVFILEVCAWIISARVHARMRACVAMAY